ncbi:GGDEF domain-containing protein [Roseospira marina]|uniref:diguanylate cyclase n=2 Tax=Roseospira marina TaxID=140057 RepID=A0A5M6IDF8_9PROT|nr:GGDEF domain-containing protein [Roseospira marina]KAA5606311.1 GGDEF domain-containing protein [Roseospira marina]
MTDSVITQLERGIANTVDIGPLVPCLIVLAGHEAGRLHVLDGGETLIGRADECDIRFLESTVSRHHARCVRAPDGVEIFDLRSSNGLFVNGQRVRRHGLSNQDVVGLGLSVAFKFAMVTAAEKLSFDRLFDNAVHDALTKLYNMRYLMGVLERRLAWARRRLDSVALLMVDLDHFKSINDTFGHPFGDLALCHVAAVLRQECRDNDTLCRYGGEEFIMLVSDVRGEEALRIAERVRQTIAETPLVSQGRTVSLTASVGLARASEVEGVADRLLALADERLYAAKRQGRNRVCWGAADAPQLLAPS